MSRLPNATKAQTTKIKEVCDVVGYQGVLQALINIAKENHEVGQFKPEFLEEAHSDHITDLQDARKHILETSRSIKKLLNL